MGDKEQAELITALVGLVAAVLGIPAAIVAVTQYLSQASTRKSVTPDQGLKLLHLPAVPESDIRSILEDLRRGMRRNVWRYGAFATFYFVFLIFDLVVERHFQAQSSTLMQVTRCGIFVFAVNFLYSAIANFRSGRRITRRLNFDPAEDPYPKFTRQIIFKNGYDEVVSRCLKVLRILKADVVEADLTTEHGGTIKTLRVGARFGYAPALPLLEAIQIQIALDREQQNCKVTVSASMYEPRNTRFLAEVVDLLHE